MKKIYGFLFIGILAITTLFMVWMHAHKKASKAPYLTVFGPVKMKDGIGKQAVDLIQALKDEISIGFVSTQQVELSEVPKEVLPFLKKNKKIKGKVAILEDVVWLPENPAYKKFIKHTSKEQVRIAYSMFESTQIPQEWVLIFNNFFDAVAVPDPYFVKVYERCGVTIPVFELPLGLHLDKFFEQLPHQKNENQFVFGNLGACIERKNQLTLVRAFAKAFGDNPQILLKINCRSGEPSLIRSIKEEIALLGLHNVQFTQLPLDSATYLKLFKSLDCFVSLSKGEGFSIQPREAMALGIPVILTDNTAQSSLCESGFVRSVISKKPEIATYFWGMSYGERFNCSIDEASLALTDVYKNYDLFLEKINEARDWVQKYDYQSLKSKYLNLVKPKNIILGKENKITEEYLMTTSESLFQKYQNISEGK